MVHSLVLAFGLGEDLSSHHKEAACAFWGGGMLLCEAGSALQRPHASDGQCACQLVSHSQ